tara:strand:- start:3420 stop:3677 length:258 start_codon:yes stop_codon:yes gene_type:complete
MFNPIERGRQLREQRQLAKGCGFCGIADNTPETALYQSMGASAPTADSLRISRTQVKPASFPQTIRKSQPQQLGTFPQTRKIRNG